ncbi:MAG: signal recognition particle-docking protein FtsY [Candidatus Xenobia bacterium]
MDNFKNLFGKKKAEEPGGEGLTPEEEAAADALADQQKPAEPPPEAERGPNWMDRLKSGLSRTRENFVGQMRSLFGRGIDDAFWEDLETILLSSDVGVTSTERIVSDLQKRRINDPQQLYAALKDDLVQTLAGSGGTLNFQESGPTVVMVVGVNGTGKTTTIAKLAAHFKSQGKKVLLGAADTFRAAAIDQLQIWADRVEVDCIKGKDGGDPAAVAFDAVNAAKARGSDILIVDTAGRLQSQVNLMEELKKIWRVLGRELPGAPHECLLVLDAQTGQNALSQARTFKQAVGVTGLVMTKMDGSAKGGILIALAQEMGIPVKFIGIGEKLDDLQEFNPQEFADALFSN